MSYDNLSSVSQNVLKFYHQLAGEERRVPFIFDDFHFCLFCFYYFQSFFHAFCTYIFVCVVIKTHISSLNNKLKKKIV